VPSAPFAGNEPADEFKGALTEAIRLAERSLKHDAGDIGARFDAGAAYGLQASYMAALENGYTGAFRYARRAFETQSEVLDRDASYAAAGLIAGNYRYMIASQMVVVRFFAFFAGFSGDKDRGIALLEAASHDPMTRVEAKTALMQIYSREGRYNEALRLTRELGIELPRNRLVLYEEGSAAIRAGRDDEADTALSRGLASFDSDTRPKIPGERALWFYKRGLARVNLDRLAEAATDLRAALDSGPLGWTVGRIHVALGHVADLSGHRSDALAEYARAKAACQASPDARCRDDARLGLRQPFTR
jgi:tetratricopeptide (TPR) repeat protein